MNTKLAATLAATIAIITATSTRVLAENKSVVGEWIAATPNKKGLGATRTFDKNGAVVVSFGASLDMKYKLEANTIETTAPDGTVKRMDFVIAKDTLTLTEKDHPPLSLTRVKGTEGEGLVGKWTGMHYTGAQQVMEFTTHMNYYFSVPIQSETGTYVIEADTLIEKFQNPKMDHTWKWNIADGVLTLTDSTPKHEQNYKRKE